MRLTGVIVASIGMMLATAALLLGLKLGAVGAAAGWGWLVVLAPLWGPWLAVAIAAFCVCCYKLLARLEKLAG